MFNQQLENNPEQRAAVQRIVAGSSKPAPHLVFGPPGTGKTITMVEAMQQVLSLSLLDKYDVTSFGGREMAIERGWGAWLPRRCHCLYNPMKPHPHISKSDLIFD